MDYLDDILFIKNCNSYVNIICHQCSRDWFLLLTWINFDPIMDK